METAIQSAVLIGSFGRATVSMGTRGVVAHAHAEFNFLFHIDGAATAFRVGDRSLPLDSEHMIVLCPWTTHAKVENASNPTLLLSLLIDPAWLETNVYGPASGDRVFPRRSVCTTPALRSLAERLVRGIHGIGTAQGEPAHVELLRDLVAAVCHRYGQEKPVLRGGRVDSRVRRAIAYIQQHAAQNPDLLTVAAHAGLSRSQFFARFKDSVGVTPQHYLDWVRLHLAVGMLATSDLPLAEVAAQLGFYAPSHFTRFFAQHIAIPPSEFRRCLVACDRRDRLEAGALYCQLPVDHADTLGMHAHSTRIEYSCALPNRPETSRSPLPA
jgi:AraC family transcriptional regulator